MHTISAKVLVLGGGPGGYVTAIRAGQLDLDTVLIDQSRLGGTCLNVGCIPSKALIHAADEFHRIVNQKQSPFGITLQKPAINLARTIEWKDDVVSRLNTGVAALLKRSNVKTLHGRGKMLDGKTCQVETDTGPATIKAEHVVLATGSAPVELANLPFGGNVISSTEALSLAKVPGMLAVIGAGYIGLELGIAFAKLGSKVTVIEMMDRILPQYDSELTRPMSNRLKELGIEVHLGAKAKASDGKALVFEKAHGEETKLPVDKILVTVGRRPLTKGFGLEQLDLAMNGGFVRIDERCATSMRNVWAVGDVTGEPMLAHRAMAQGETVAEIISGAKRRFEPQAIPAICFTDPEIVSAGLSPSEARDKGIEIVTGHFPLMANGRALTMNADDGFVRVVARADNHLVLGVQAVGTAVSELSSAFTLALEMGARLEDVALTIHAHPTLGEAFHESTLRALGHALHI
jgi:dihydrolipoamide dehydrogenase